MVKWNNEIVKYSLLVAGESLDIEKIRPLLKYGIKVLWFGSEDDGKILEEEFHDYLENFFLCFYQCSGGIQLTVIDGETIKDEHVKLESLEREDPGFNLKQYEIEHNGVDPLVVVQAGAGSGKTFVMNNRLLYLLHTREDFRLRDVVMVTFTNEATDSMRRKLIELLNNKLLLTGNNRYLRWVEEVPQITISTIHSFFKRIIVEVGPLLGYGTNLRLTSMVMEKRTIMRDIINEKYGDSNDYVSSVLGLPLNELEKLAMEFWKKIENHGMSESEVSSMVWGKTEDGDAAKIQDSLLTLFGEVEERYNYRKMVSNSIAMGDIIHEFSRVVDDTKLKEYISSRYRYLFCDEFQDSDDVQIRTIAVLDRLYDGNLFVVGDVKQSIYRFRGATDSAFERLGENIKKEFDEDYIKESYSLAKNYRTSENILNKMDQIFRTWGDKGYLKYKYIGNNTDVLTPQVHKRGEYKQIVVYRKADRERKFIDLINKIEKDIDIQKKKNEADNDDYKKSIMVLARYNWQLQTVKKWCEKAGKVCTIRERGSFFRSPAVRDFCSLVEALLYHSEPIYLFNLLRSAYCFKTIDDGSLESFSGSTDGLTAYFKSLISEEIEWEKKLDELRNRPVMAVLCELITERRPSVIYGAIQKQMYLTGSYDDEKATEQAAHDARQYEADLQKLLQMLSDSFADEFSTLADICDYIRIRINTDTEEEPADVQERDSKDCIQGSTVHGAKGLEFDYVLIPFMDDTFGKNDRSEILIDKYNKKVGWQYKKDKNDIGTQNVLYKELVKTEAQEVIGDETRLLYVAMTRAIEGLYCFTWWKRNHGPAQTWSDLLPEDDDDANYL